ncbi:MAG TPA: response regulator [Gemmatimonadales bacterium]|nr:response regulator [Gemmatimonadales bacterium]
MRVLIADDEELARTGIRQLLATRPDIEVVAECANGIETITAIGDHGPDLVFLDVQMPGLGGFEVIEHIGGDAMPPVIFVTAYDAHALRAFETHAVDYLLKPIDPDRFRTALDRARTRIASTKLTALIEDVSRDTALEQIAVKHDGRISFVNVDTIDWIEATGNYVTLHVGAATHAVRHTLERLERRLGSRRFIRIRRDALVSLAAITSLEPYLKGSYVIHLRNGGKLLSSRSFAARLRELLARSR